MEASPTGILSTETFFSWWDEPKKMASALLWLNFRKFVSIQCCMSVMQRTIRSTISSEVTSDGLNEKYVPLGVIGVEVVFKTVGFYDLAERSRVDREQLGPQH